MFRLFYYQKPCNFICADSMAYEGIKTTPNAGFEQDKRVILTILKNFLL